MKSNSSKDVLHQLVTGDVKVIRSIYNDNFPKILGFVLKNNGDQVSAEEIFQDALFQIITRAKVKGLEITSTFDGYLYTVCRNLWYKELNNRKKKVRNDGVFELEDKEQDHLSAILNQDRWDLFEEMLLKLSDKCRALLKDYFNKVPYDVIVRKFSYATENAAFQRVFKCKKRLMELVQNDVRSKSLMG